MLQLNCANNLLLEAWFSDDLPMVWGIGIEFISIREHHKLEPMSLRDSQRFLHLRRKTKIHKQILLKSLRICIEINILCTFPTQQSNCTPERYLSAEEIVFRIGRQQDCCDN